MNLLHLADLHLGKRVNGFDLLPDQRYILEQVLDLCTAHNVQAVALAGDIYDTALPPAAAVLLLDWFLTELAHQNIPVLAAQTGVRAFHLSGKQVLQSRMTFRREGVPMGLPGFSEFEVWQTSEANIRAARQALDSL